MQLTKESQISLYFGHPQAKIIILKQLSQKKKIILKEAVTFNFFLWSFFGCQMIKKIAE